MVTRSPRLRGRIRPGSLVAVGGTLISWPGSNPPDTRFEFTPTSGERVIAVPVHGSGVHVIVGKPLKTRID